MKDQEDKPVADTDSHAVAGVGFGVADLFEVTPMALWLEDYSQLWAQFDAWRAQGVVDLAARLAAHPEDVAQCARLIRVLRVNRQALSLYEADSEAVLMARLPDVLRGAGSTSFASELVQMWSGSRHFEGHAVNYTLSGRRMDLSLKGVILGDVAQPWDRVLVAVEDVTPLHALRREALDSARMARELFDQAPVSLWVEDFSQIKVLLDELRECGIVDFRTFLNVHEEFVDRCMREIRLVDVNDYTLKLFKARSRAELRERLGEIFQGEMRFTFAEQLIELWEGRLFHVKEVQNRTLQGDLLHLHLQLSVFRGSENDWSKVLLSLTDITARKKAEAYLEYLGQHDVLTQLKNRSFFVDELGRLARRQVPVVAMIALDLNNLKYANDVGGHSAGDDLLRRFGEVLNNAVDEPAHAARVGGDEFMVVLPGLDRPEADRVLRDIRALVELNNQYYSGTPLSVSAGVAVCRDPSRMEQAMREADRAMYEEKRRYYQQHDRRRGRVRRRRMAFRRHRYRFYRA